MGLYGWYTNEVIFEFLTNVDDDVIVEAKANLLKRAQSKPRPCGVVTLTPIFLTQAAREKADARVGRELEQARASMVGKMSRVYLVGHGDWQNQKIGGWEASRVAELVSRCNPPRDTVVSIIGCQLARDGDSTGYGLLGRSVDSFAAQFHRLMRDTYHVELMVFARTKNVGVHEKEFQGADGRKGVFATDSNLKRPLDWEHRVAKSKVLFSWVSGKQVRSWVNYERSGTVPVDD